MTSIAFTSLFLGLVLGVHPFGVALERPAAPRRLPNKVSPGAE
ncbi:MAG TPA: hypothetical protein VGS98_13310 [Thermoanaerobaculia bacterium]|jgi:hypothetical protein|nr:hypothetical protein [Thermoanaerobaculia bacterium]